MSALTDFDLDDTGKINLNSIYDRPDPRDYYQTLVNLDYRIPAEGAPVFRKVIEVERSARKRTALKLLDVGCSYGVNAAILKHERALPDLFRAYSAATTGAFTRRELLARDRAIYKGSGNLTVIGLDPAERAVGYAREAGILDGYLTRDLEIESPDEEERALLADVDLVISTGAIGYVGVPTFTHIIESAERRPWLALFTLRMFSFDAIAEMLKAHGYAVFKLDGKTFHQRHFADGKERAEVFANLDALGLDPAGHESDGWYHAEFFFARPADEDISLPLPGLMRI
jgi:SAM-dependent methyltransferase